MLPATIAEALPAVIARVLRALIAEVMPAIIAEMLQTALAVVLQALIAGVLPQLVTAGAAGNSSLMNCCRLSLRRSCRPSLLCLQHAALAQERVQGDGELVRPATREHTLLCQYRHAIGGAGQP